METKPLKVYLIAACILLALPASTAGKVGKKKEKDYQQEWCSSRGKSEYRLPDRTRVDCLTDTHAIEFDWAKKWHEGIGQSLFYSLHTGKRAGVVLIARKRKDYKYWIRLNSTIDHHELPIDTWLIEDY